MASPNILLIMDDQHRWDYLGCYGADFVDTPYIDRLASRGIRFNNTFTNVPVCAPARIGLATGMHPARIGTLDNNTYLPSQYPTYYQRLRDSGYRVGCVGKLDLAKPDKYNGRYGDRPSVYSWDGRRIGVSPIRKSAKGRSTLQKGIPMRPCAVRIRII